MDNFSVKVDTDLYTEALPEGATYTDTDDNKFSLNEFIEKVRRVPIRGIIDEQYKIPNRNKK